MASGTIRPIRDILVAGRQSFVMSPGSDRRPPTNMRHTKIIATVGPACDSDPMLDALIAAGTDIFRLNFSHGTHESQGATFARVRAAGERARRTVAILQDLGGPKIRTGRLKDGRPLHVDAGDTLRIATGDFVGGPGR